MINFRYSEMLEEREVLLQEMEGAEITERSLPQWKNLENALKRLDAQVISAHNELKLLTFHYQLLNQDFQVLMHYNFLILMSW